MTSLLVSVSSLLMGFRKRVCSAVRLSGSASARLRGEFFRQIKANSKGLATSSG